MNKKQLIVTWIATTLICIVFIGFPKKHLVYIGSNEVMYLDEPVRTGNSIPITQWGYVTPICVSLSLVGGLLIYTLKDKKK